MLPFAGDARYVGIALNQFYFAVYLSCFLAVLSVGICIVEHEYLLKYGNDAYDDYRLALLCLHLLTTAILCLNIWFSYEKKLWWLKCIGKLTKHDDICNTKVYKDMLFEISMNLICPMPFLYKVKYTDHNYVDGADVEVQVNTILFILMVLIRLYHINRSLMISTEFMSNRANRVAPIYGVNAGYTFCLRSIFRAYPFIFCYSNYAFYTIVFGYLFRSIEYEANQGEISDSVFTLSNSMWCSIITMTTVGYGDFYPKTILGRFVGYAASFVGVALESLVILTVQKILKHTVSQTSAYTMLVSLAKKAKLKRRAGKMLVAMYRLRHCADDKVIKYSKKHSNLSHKFSQKFREIRSNYVKNKAFQLQQMVHSTRKEVHKCIECVQALNIYTKNKSMPRRIRRNFTKRFHIPGYSDVEKTVAHMPTSVPVLTKKTIEPEEESSEYDDSSSIVFSESVSSILPSKSSIYE